MPYLNIDKNQIYYQKSGAGKLKIILLHGLLIDDLSSLYFTLFPALSNVAEVVVYDFKGHGMSSVSEGEYQITDFTLELKNIVNQLFPNERVILIGQSFGGIVATVFAHEHPKLTQGVALIDSYLPTQGWPKRLLRGINQPELMFEKLLQLKNAPTYTPRRIKKITDKVSQLKNGTTLINDLMISKYLVTSELKNIHCKFIAFFGDKSDILEEARNDMSDLPNIEIKIIDECSHFIIAENLEQLIEELLGWVKFQSAR